MADLERQLREMAVEWPPTPDIAAAIRPRLAPRRRPWRRWMAAAALAALGATAAIEPARSAVLELLGLRTARVERRPLEPRPRPFGAELDLGRPATLAAAERGAGLRIAPPTALGPPDGVHLSLSPPGVVSLVYAARPGLPRSGRTGAGLLVQVVEASLEGPLIDKAAGAGVRVERVPGGYFLSGAPHGFTYARPNGTFHQDEQRLAGNTLIIERGGVLVRVEGRIGRDRALAIAATLEAAPSP